MNSTMEGSLSRAEEARKQFGAVRELSKDEETIETLKQIHTELELDLEGPYNATPEPEDIEGTAQPEPWQFRAPLQAWPSLETAATTADRAGTGPQLAPAWTANAVVSYGGALGDARGTFLRDAARQRWRLSTCQPETLFRPDGKLCFDQLTDNLAGSASYKTNTTVGQGSNAVCKVMPSPYYDLFFGLASARHLGSGSITSGPHHPHGRLRM